MFWGYFSLSQFLIIYSGNLPEEITYFLSRMTGFWEGLGTFLTLGAFFIPFLCLLSGKTKRTPGLLLNLAIGMFIVRILDYFWTVIPFFIAGNREFVLQSYWVVIPALAAVGGIWLLVFGMMIPAAPLIPLHEPRVAEMEALEHA